jgi:hypothetical protein
MRSLLDRAHALDLAASFGRDVAQFKIDVRKLKNLGHHQPRAGLPTFTPGVAYLLATTATSRP